MRRQAITMFLAALSFGLAAMTATSAAELVELWRTGGFDLPESVSYDAQANVFYVSNLGNDPMTKDGNGFIAKLKADGTLDNLRWVTGLNAPKGTEIAGDKLYVTDIDEVVEIDIPAGKISSRIPVAGAKFLNDLAIAVDGRIFVSDTMGGAIFLVENGQASEWLSDGKLVGPNGLVIEGYYLVVAELGDISQGFDKLKPGTVKKIDLASKEVTPYGTADVIGGLDGIEKTKDGGVLVSDHPGGKIFKVMPGQAAVEVATVKSGAADFELATMPTGPALLILPSMSEGAVVGYKAPP